MIEIKSGHTNKKKYRDGNKFIIYKTNNGFNHQIDYKLLAQFDFVPKLFEETTEKIVGEFIEGEVVETLTDQELKTLASYMRQLHKSDLKFPKNNFRRRYKAYLETAHQKGIKMPEVEQNGGEMNRLVSRMSKLNPCHNDLGNQNLIRDPKGKLGIVDGEYATMGDKHFDLAFFIDSFELNAKQEQVFLEAYNSFDNYGAYIPEGMNRYKKFTSGFTLTGANAQLTKPFDLKPLQENVNKY